MKYALLLILFPFALFGQVKDFDHLTEQGYIFSSDTTVGYQLDTTIRVYYEFPVERVPRGGSPSYWFNRMVFREYVKEFKKD